MFFHLQLKIEFSEGKFLNFISGHSDDTWESANHWDGGAGTSGGDGRAPGPSIGFDYHLDLFVAFITVPLQAERQSIERPGTWRVGRQIEFNG